VVHRFDTNGRNRRIFLVAASSGEGLLTERRTAAQPWWHELAFMPPKATFADQWRVVWSIPD